MIVTKKALPRRTFLRGVGAALALPLLDAMVPAMTASAATAAKPVRRLGFVYVPMGADIAGMDAGRPTGRSTSSRPSLKSLEPVMRSAHRHHQSRTEATPTPGTTPRRTPPSSSAANAKWTEGTDYYLGTTVDQIAAQHIGQETRLPSLELAMDLLTTVGQCDNGYACVYQNNLSWSSPTTPLPAEAHPRIVFERLFGDGGSDGRPSAPNCARRAACSTG